MTMVVRDEEDVVGANLDYHLAQGVDAILVTDHASSDGTPEILARSEPLPVWLDLYSNVDYPRSSGVARLPLF